ncbi:ComEC/Rec2 family competence protein [Cellulomonas telluris]|uniref:ComEC/Rec2 family competence protein n=1 Tax=Cellulomonas telluris TaxID=2306636 RepID=UPI0010A93408|nr:ComEC/Rec2 family competence protein [Cellulomonas telluris]
MSADGDAGRARSPAPGGDGSAGEPAEGATGDGPRPRTDLRLLPPAVTAWVAAATAVLAPPGLLRPAAVVAVAALLPVAALLLAPRRLRRARAVPAALLALAVGACVLAAGAAQRAAAHPPDLARAAAGGDVVQVVGRVSGVARVVTGGTGPPRTLLPVAAEEVRAASTGVLLASGVPVVLALDPGTAPLALATDTRIAVQGRASARPQAERAGTTVAADRPPSVLLGPRPWYAWSSTARQHARDLGASLPGDAGALLPGVTVGETGQVPGDLADALRASGLTHLTAVSGAHFALLGALVLGAAAAARAPTVARVLAAAAAGAALVLVVGPEPSVVRAAVMGGVGLLALLAGRRAAGPAALCTAVVGLLVHDPWLAPAPGFALSVAATAGLVVLGPRLVERWSAWCGRTGAAALAAPVAAQLGCLPVVLALWPTLPVWAVPANLAAAPVVGPATVLGLAALLLAPWWPGGAEALAAVAGAACWWIGAVARWCAALPAAGVAWLPGPLGAVAAAVVAVSATVLLGARSGRR